jgi:sulfur carrier protein ThiS adenylyltransferase
MSDFINFVKKGLGRDYIAKAGCVKIGIAGCGGLGGNCAFNLVRSGFVQLRLVDFDIVEASNINRQFFFFPQIGMPKVEALAENLKNINSALKLDVMQKKINRKNLKKIFSDCDIIVEALDGENDKAMVIEGLMPIKRFIVSASGIAGFGNSDRIKTHYIKDNLVIIGDLSTGVNQALPLSPIVNIAAAKQADAIIEYIMKANI